MALWGSCKVLIPALFGVPVDSMRAANRVSTLKGQQPNGVGC